MVSRLTRQKGLDLLLSVFDELMKEDVGLVLLGTGDTEYEESSAAPLSGPMGAPRESRCLTRRWRTASMRAATCS